MAKRRTEQEVAEALTLAEATSLREAARQTGIPLTTLHRRYRAAHGTPVPSGTAPKPGTERRLGKKLKDMAGEVQAKAVAQATEKVAEVLTERLTGLAERLYGLAEKAAGKVETAIADTEETPTGKKAEPHNQAGAAWVRSLVGVFAQSLEKAQLLAGKPTGRTEVLNADEARERLTGRLDELALRRGEKAAPGGTA